LFHHQVIGAHFLRYSTPLLMSALGNKQTFELAPAMSALPSKADILRGGITVR